MELYILVASSSNTFVFAVRSKQRPITVYFQVYSLHLYESSLLNLGSEGMQVTLKSASKTLGEKVARIETSVGLVSFLSGEKSQLQNCFRF